MLNIIGSLAVLVVLGIGPGSIGTSSSIAAEPVIGPRGTSGLLPIAFSARNGGNEPIDCEIAAAHWYSVDLGTAPPGGEVRADLWASMATGEIFVLNDTKDHIPVQSLWCGIAGRAWATRSLVALARQAGRTPVGIALVCQDEGARLGCR